MEWLGDYLRFCLEHGFGGIALLALTGGLTLLVGIALIYGVTRAAQAFSRGWNDAA